MIAFMDSSLPALKALSQWAVQNAFWALPLVAVLLTLSWLRAGTARLRWWLGALIFLRLLLPPLPWSLITLPTGAASAPVVSVNSDLNFVSRPLNTSNQVVSESAVAIEWGSYLALLWLIGVGVIAVWLVVGLSRTASWVRSRRVRNDTRVVAQWHQLGSALRMGRMPEVVTLTGLGQIAIHGFWRPRLLVPEGLADTLTRSQLSGVLAHEMAHVRRWDVAWNWLGLIACALQWFNPLAWLVYRRFRADTELICDATALQHTAAGRQEYGEAMLTLLEQFSDPLPLPLSSFLCRKTDLKHRIHMIAKRSAPTLGARLLAWLVLPIFGVAFLTAAEREGDRSSREGERGAAEREGDRPRKEGAREGDGAKKEGAREGDGAKKEGTREGDGAKKVGARDGDGARKAVARDGDGAKKEGARDGDRPRAEGTRDGERPRGEGARDGDKPKTEGAKKEGDRAAREGERTSKEGDRRAREGERPSNEGDRAMREGAGGERNRGGEAAAPTKSGATSTSIPMVLTMNAAGQVVSSDGRVIAPDEVKRRLSSIFAANPDQEITIKGDASTKYSDVMALIDLLHDAGGKNVGLGK